MFGFVTINPQSLDDSEENRYREVYCGQCHALGARNHQLSRFAVSHDLTFMALLLQSLYEPEEKKEESACLFHPCQKRLWSSSEIIDYASDMTLALMYHKLLDDWRDDGNRMARFAAHISENDYLRIKMRWPRQCQAMEDGLRRISEIERDPDGNPDAAGNVFGMILGEIFVYKHDFWEEDLRLLGARLGRFIYMMDAAMDRDDDQEKGSYNPLLDRGLEEDDLRSLLMLYMQGVTDVFERLPLEQDIDLLRNVLYSGVWSQYNNQVIQQSHAEEQDPVATWQSMQWRLSYV